MNSSVGATASRAKTALRADNPNSPGVKYLVFVYGKWHVKIPKYIAEFQDEKLIKQFIRAVKRSAGLGRPQ